MGYILYFGFDCWVLDVMLFIFIILVLMINVRYFDVRCLFVSFLFLDVLKVEVWGYDVLKGVVNLVFGFGKKGVDVVGVFGFF